MLPSPDDLAGQPRFQELVVSKVRLMPNTRITAPIDKEYRQILYAPQPQLASTDGVRGMHDSGVPSVLVIEGWEINVAFRRN